MGISLGIPRHTEFMKPRVSHDWAENKKVKLLSKDEVKHLVNTNQWAKLGEIFGFVPAFHFEGKNFLDWRCVPKALLEVLKQKPEKKTNNEVVKRERKKMKEFECLPSHVRDALKSVGQLELGAAKNNHRVQRLCVAGRTTMRHKLYIEQKGICHFCRQFVTMAESYCWTTDHLTPLSKGGTNARENLRGSCYDCNHAKKAMSEKEFLKSEFLKQKMKALGIPTI